MWKPDDKHRYLKPIVVLVSAATGSSAEDFVTAFDTMKRGTIIGEATAGSSGQPYSFGAVEGLSLDKYIRVGGVAASKISSSSTIIFPRQGNAESSFDCK